MARPVERDELTRRAQRAISGLDRAITAVDAGDVGSFDEIASRLRLLVTRGRGNRLLFRVAEVWGRTLNPVPIAIPPPQSPGENLTFALENLPAGVIVGPLSYEVIPLEELMGRAVLTVDPHYASDDRSTAPNEPHTHAWTQLVLDVANKLGPIHADDDVPEIFDEISRYWISDMNPAAYALRVLATATSGIGGKLLRDVGVDHPQVQHAPDVQGTWIGRLRAWGRLGGRVSFDVLGGQRQGEIQEPLQFQWSRNRPTRWP